MTASSVGTGYRFLPGKDIKSDIAFFFPAGFGELTKEVRGICPLAAKSRTI